MTTTEFFDDLAKLAGVTFVVSSMLAMGLSLTLPQIVAPLGNVRLVVLALVANFVLVPALAYGLAKNLTFMVGWLVFLGVYQVAETTYRPAGWRHEPLRLIVRRVPFSAHKIADGSLTARRRKTIHPEQLALALDGQIASVFGYSFI